MAKIAQVDATYFAANVEYFITCRRAAKDDVARALLMTPRTLCRRLHERPGGFTLEEILRCARYLSVAPEVLMRQDLTRAPEVTV